MKRLASICFILSLIIVLTGCEKKEPEVTVGDSVQYEAQEEVVSTALPSMSEVKAAEQPLLYDFVFGCLDWHVSIHRDTLDSDLYLMRNVQAPSTVYTDWYPIQAGFTVPPLGSTIETIELSARETDMYNTIVSELPDLYVLREGDWELVIYAGDAARSFQKYDYSFRGKYKYTESRVPPFLATNAGWPTDWLRREPYATAMQEAGINMGDGWFDFFNYRGKYTLTTDDGQPNSEGYSVVCTGVREFALCDKDGKMSFGMTYENVMETCNALECNLGEFYKHGSWESEIPEQT